MDFSKNTVLKENYTFLVATEDGFATGGEQGLYNRDTRFLSHYAWQFPEGTQTLLSYTPRPDQLELHHSVFDTHYQRLAIRRSLLLAPDQLSDTLILENTSQEPVRFTLELTLQSDFADLFEARGWHQLERDVVKTVEGNRVRFAYRAKDGLDMSLDIHCSEAFKVTDDKLAFEFELAAGRSETLRLDMQIKNPLETGAINPVSYECWHEQFPVQLEKPAYQQVLSRAVDDLRALLIFDEAGTFPAAGIPWFVTAFGRDSLLTSFMLLPYAPDTARGNLHYLAEYQATDFDSFRNAQPGKILHEMRYGELTRTGKTPHGPYYGTVDATPLFIMLLHELFIFEGDLTLVKALRSNWEAALTWLIDYGDLDGDSFLEFKAPDQGEGLSIQSWKDSGDSMSHADGSLAQGALAVAEVQGYTYAAYLAAVAFYKALGESERAYTWQERANKLKETFHQAFWLDELQTYAMALDGAKRPLEVQNSDAGQLLLTGIVPEDYAPRLIKTLMSDALWTGWGIRTLGKDEVRYNPVSYHNGSVWPHDTALIAAGMWRYGFKQEARQLAEAIFDLALSQADLRPAELIAGYPRRSTPPVPYPTACRPQAWDAAALLYLARML